MIFQKLNEISSDGCEQIIFCQDKKTNLRAIIAIHSTLLGPATGGCRMWNYDHEADALFDVVRLARGMTFKAALANLRWGGGKAVILGDPKTGKSKEKFEKFGEFVQRLSGHYITAKDVGIDENDLKIMKNKTQYVLGIEGEPGSSGDPSLATAWGVYHGMKSAARLGLGEPSLKGLKVAIQGLGSVAFALCQYLSADGAKIIACDTDPSKIKRSLDKYPTLEIVNPETIFDAECDIFSPCALGAVLNSQTIPKIKAKIIAGAANNQLLKSEDGNEIFRKSIIYVPDYVINAGGLINIYYEKNKDGTPYSRLRAYQHIETIGITIEGILTRSRSENIPTHIIADTMAEERVRAAQD